MCVCFIERERESVCVCVCGWLVGWLLFTWKYFSVINFLTASADRKGHACLLISSKYDSVCYSHKQAHLGCGLNLCLLCEPFNNAY